ncbi:hypothetical protein SEA_SCOOBYDOOBYDOO_82 [Mycobacterium phage ScoobyDoobyDoo]|nr:hypothetical protein SEA_SCOOBYDOOBYDOO_82 [Mycobacterium phage ScoobyDoobyDoo]
MASADLCSTCRAIKEIAYTEPETNRTFCRECALQLPPTTEELALLFIQLTCPFKVGDRVEARTAGTVFDGVGTVDQVSTQIINGGTPVYPSFHVVLETKEHDQAPDDAWYTEICLRRVENV